MQKAFSLSGNSSPSSIIKMTTAFRVPNGLTGLGNDKGMTLTVLGCGEPLFLFSCPPCSFTDKHPRFSDQAHSASLFSRAFSHLSTKRLQYHRQPILTPAPQHPPPMDPRKEHPPTSLPASDVPSPLSASNSRYKSTNPEASQSSRMRMFGASKPPT